MVTKSKDGVGEMLKLGVVLCLYAVCACTILAIVNYFTLPIITSNKLATAQKAMKSVFSDADNFEKVETFDSTAADALGVAVSDVYMAKNGDSVIGAVCQAEGTTYDRAKIMIGLTASGIVTKIEFLELTDSPGFGQKARDSSYHVASGKTFFEQFSGLDSAKGFTHGNGGTIDAISGATITTVGVEKILTAGTAVLRSVLGAAPIDSSAINNMQNIDTTSAATQNTESLDTNSAADTESTPLDSTQSVNNDSAPADSDDKSANGDAIEYIESAGV